MSFPIIEKWFFSRLNKITSVIPMKSVLPLRELSTNPQKILCHFVNALVIPLAIFLRILATQLDQLIFLYSGQLLFGK